VSLPSNLAVSSVSPARPLGVKVAAALAGALFVAAAAQVSVPLFGTPVPLTLSPLAALIVGGLLGPRLGAASLVAYLALGAAGLPVFTPFGAPGLARLVGPTGGYLLAYPAAAALTGYMARRWTGLLETAVAATAGIVVIHLGGLAQLLALTGSLETAFAAGVLPFVAGDLAKAFLAAVAVHRLGNLTRALR
jgi:biotin transport system substrate-specific component